MLHLTYKFLRLPCCTVPPPKGKTNNRRTTHEVEKGRAAQMVVSYGTGTIVWGTFCPVAAATVCAVRGVACTRFR